MNKNRLKLLMVMSFLPVSLIYAQEKKDSDTATKFLEEDLEYEMTHKSQPWFSNMKDGANYYEVKNNFDTYFGNHQWEKSKPRALGENWLKEKIFYLDKNGNVQAEPKIDLSKRPIIKNTLNVASTTTIIGDWTLLGPVNSATTGVAGYIGNHGGYAYLNKIDPTNPNKMFTSFVTGGLWMTADAGTTWTLTDSNLADDYYLDIDVAISNPQTVYAISKQQVIKSIDGGLNWLPTTMTSANYFGTFYDITVSTANPDIVLARIGDQIYRTIDGGTTWTSVILSLRNHTLFDSSLHCEMLEWNSSDSNVVYSVSTYHDNEVEVHRSGDAGATFTLVNTITLDPTANGQVVGWAKIFTPTSNTDSFYVAVGSGDNAYGHHAVHLYKLNSTTGVVESVKTNMITGTSPLELHHGDIDMDKVNENLIAFGTYFQKKIHVSTDNGDTFVESAAQTHSDIRSVNVNDGRILIGSDGESALTTDNGTIITTLTNSISNHELWGFGSAFKTDLVASGNNHGPVMIKEAGNGFDWYDGTGADQGNTDVNPLDDRYIYSQGYSNYRYFRTGVHTLENQSNFLDVGGIYAYFNSIEFHPNKYYTIITHHAGAYPTGNPNLATWKKSLIKTEDNGNSISIVKTFDDQVFREKISMKNPNHMYVVEGLTNNKLWHTDDEGGTWTDITPSTAASSGQTNISDIAVGDENPNEIWVTYSGVQSTCKILKSSDYGVTWTNLTQNILTDSPLTKIIFQRGSNGGVYVGNKSGVYYRNNTMANWELLGNGLPMCDVRFMFINYNEGKLKIGTSRGAFTHDLYETSPTNALISASTTKVTCPIVDKVQFKDYSVVRNATATWAWSFPGGTPSTSSLENPEVSYEGAADGKYSVSLTVTDATGTSTQTLTDFIEVSSVCGNSTPEKIPGNSATLNKASNDYLELNDLNLDKNSFTFSAWIKPNGVQDDYSGVFMTQSGDAFGLNFREGNNTLGFHPAWSWDSNLIAPADQWSHVALVSNGTDVKLYVNGVESINNTAMASSVFTSLDFGRYGNGRGDRYTDMEMDEISIWNRALTKDEIRQWRHLTKSTDGEPILTGLVGYFQFNESTGNISLNKSSNSNYIEYKGTSGSNHNASTVPVFDGVSEKMTINSAGSKNFSTVDLTLTFANGTYPNGDVWVSKSSVNPDQLPDDKTYFNTYTIINNYGTNQTFTPLENMKFADADYTYTAASDYKLYKRTGNGFGATWGSSIDTGDMLDVITGLKTQVTFSTGLSVDGFSQFVLSNESATLSIDSKEKALSPKLYPNPVKKGMPFIINVPTDWNGASMVIMDNLGRNVGHMAIEPGDNEIILNMTTGLYHVVISNQTKKYNTKIVVE